MSFPNSLERLRFPLNANAGRHGSDGSSAHRSATELQRICDVIRGVFASYLQRMRVVSAVYPRRTCGVSAVYPRRIGNAPEAHPASSQHRCLTIRKTHRQASALRPSAEGMAAPRIQRGCAADPMRLGRRSSAAAPPITDRSCYRSYMAVRRAVTYSRVRSRSRPGLRAPEGWLRVGSPRLFAPQGCRRLQP